MDTPPPETAAPETCPFCSSVNIKTTSKEVNTSTYWRCAACGQIWNAGRLQQGRRTAPRRYV
jgi:transposase-like protein